MKSDAADVVVPSPPHARRGWLVRETALALEAGQDWCALFGIGTHPPRHSAGHGGDDDTVRGPSPVGVRALFHSIDLRISSRRRRYSSSEISLLFFISSKFRSLSINPPEVFAPTETRDSNKTNSSAESNTLDV